MHAFLAGADPRRMSHCPACGSGGLASVAAPVRCGFCGWQVA